MKIITIFMLAVISVIGHAQENDIFTVNKKKFDEICALFIIIGKKIDNPDIKGFVVLSSKEKEPVNIIICDKMDFTYYISNDRKTVYLNKSGGIAAEITEWYGPIAVNIGD